MLEQIEKNALDRLQKKGLKVGSFGRQGQDSLEIVTPSVSCSVEAGDFRKKTMTTYRMSADLYVLVAVKDVGGETPRRDGLYPLLEGIANILLLDKLGLDIDPLVPEGFRNITNDDFRRRQLLVYQIKFTTGFEVRKMPDEEATALVEIGLKYYLQDPEDDGVVDAEDTVTLNQ